MAIENVTTEESPDFEPAITDEMMGELERHAQLPQHGESRRLALIALARDKATLAKLFNEAPDAGFSMLEILIGFHDHISSVRDLTQKAMLRLALAAESAGNILCDGYSQEEALKIFSEALDIGLQGIGDKTDATWQQH